MCNPDFHSHFRGNVDGFCGLLGNKKPQIPAEKLQLVWLVARHYSLGNHGALLLTSSSFVYVCGQIYRAVRPVTRHGEAHRAATVNCLFVCRLFVVSPREFSAGSSSLHGNSCKSWAATRRQTWRNTESLHTSGVVDQEKKKRQNTTWLVSRRAITVCIVCEPSRPTLVFVSLRWAWRGADTHSLWTEPSCGLKMRDGEEHLLPGRWMTEFILKCWNRQWKNRHADIEINLRCAYY